MFSETDNLCMYHRFAKKQKKIVFSLLRFWTREWGHSKVKDRTRESRGEREREREKDHICDQTKISLRHQFDIEKTASKGERKIKQRHFSILTFTKSKFLWNVRGLIAGGGGCYITQQQYRYSFENKNIKLSIYKNNSISLKRSNRPFHQPHLLSQRGFNRFY